MTTLTPRTRQRVYLLAMCGIGIAWLLVHMTSEPPPSLDVLAMVAVGASLTGTTLATRGQHREYDELDDPMIVTRALNRFTMSMHGFDPDERAAGTLATCTDTLKGSPRSTSHRCTVFDGHDGLHAHYQPDLDDPTPTHRWYRLKDGSTLGW